MKRFLVYCYVRGDSRSRTPMFWGGYYKKYFYASVYARDELTAQRKVIRVLSREQGEVLGCSYSYADDDLAERITICLNQKLHELNAIDAELKTYALHETDSQREDECTEMWRRRYDLVNDIRNDKAVLQALEFSWQYVRDAYFSTNDDFSCRE